MQVVSKIEDFDSSTPTVVSVGVFDGFHLGHAAIVERLREAARLHKACSCVFTFRTHPRRVLGGARQDLIITLEHRLKLLERSGVDLALAVEFAEELASLSAERFLKDAVVGRLRAKALVVGYDARLGTGRSADADGIRELGRELGLNVHVVRPVEILGRPVSSTRVREAVQAGDLKTARALLGRRASVMGNVVHGEGRGRALGFPTANINLRREVRPPWGVYATRSRLVDAADENDGRWIPSATNVGPRLTYEAPEEGRRRDLLIETFLLEPPPLELYDRTVEVEFVRKLRDERRFGTDEELSEQIARDVEATRRVLSEEGPA